jgi:hypothetical protein
MDTNVIRRSDINDNKPKVYDTQLVINDARTAESVGWATHLRTYYVQ